MGPSPAFTNIAVALTSIFLFQFTTFPHVVVHIEKLPDDEYKCGKWLLKLVDLRHKNAYKVYPAEYSFWFPYFADQFAAQGPEINNGQA